MECLFCARHWGRYRNIDEPGCFLIFDISTKSPKVYAVFLDLAGAPNATEFSNTLTPSFQVELFYILLIFIIN